MITWVENYETNKLAWKQQIITCTQELDMQLYFHEFYNKFMNFLDK